MFIIAQFLEINNTDNFDKKIYFVNKSRIINTNSITIQIVTKNKLIFYPVRQILIVNFDNAPVFQAVLKLVNIICNARSLDISIQK